jgi:hypothetical protein
LKTGLGLCLQKIAHGIAGYSAVNQTLPLCNLSPYQHVAHLYRYCFTHFTRHVHKFRGKLDEKRCAAMMSLASADSLPDLDKTLKFIAEGGKEASGE